MSIGAALLDPLRNAEALAAPDASIVEAKYAGRNRVVAAVGCSQQASC